MDQSQSSGKEHIIEIPDNDPNLEDSSDFEQDQDDSSSYYESSIENYQSEASEKVSIDIGHLFSIKLTAY